MGNKSKDTSPKDELKKEYYKNLESILSNIRYQIIFSFILVAIGITLISYSPFIIDMFTDWIVNQVLLLILLFVPFVWSIFFLRRSFNQISSLSSLNKSVYNVRKSIRDIKKTTKDKRDFHPLQIRINKVRRDLKAYINYSEVLTPPVHNYELDRLQKSIDVFFNTIGEALFPTSFVFSRAQEIEQQEAIYYYQSQEHPTEDELAEEAEEAQKAERGEIDWFGLGAMYEFLYYLGDILFKHMNSYSLFSSKHPINLIGLSQFFNYWNGVVANCRNSKGAYEKALADIEKYYEEVGKRETERRQRMRGLLDNVLIIIISSVISIIATYLIRG